MRPLGMPLGIEPLSFKKTQGGYVGDADPKRVTNAGAHRR